MPASFRPSPLSWGEGESILTQMLAALSLSLRKKSGAGPQKKGRASVTGFQFRSHLVWARFLPPHPGPLPWGEGEPGVESKHLARFRSSRFLQKSLPLKSSVSSNNIFSRGALLLYFSFTLTHAVSGLFICAGDLSPGSC